MGVGRRTDDWQVCGIGQLAMGDGIAAGWYFFDFYSETAAITARMIFSGPGAGLGGDASGSAIPREIGGFGPWTAIKCDKSFCILDINGSWGRLTTAGLGMGLEFCVVYITAAPRWSIWESYFHSQNVGGWATGAGAGALFLVGKWYLWSIVYNTPYSNSGSSTDA